MKRFIRYLYEYKQGKRLRNVGFVKVEQEEEECAVHIHGKGLHMNGEKKLDLYLFYEEEKKCIGIWQGTVDNVNPAINYRLYYTKEDVGVPENFLRINGMILESETGRRYAAVWDDMPADVEHMQIWKQRPEGLEERMAREVERRTEEPQQAEELQRAEEPQGRKELQQAEELQRAEEPQQAEELQNTEQADNLSKVDGIEDQSCNVCAEDRDTEKDTRKDVGKDIAKDTGNDAEEEEEKDTGKQPGIECMKIQRSDMAKLPRCEWRWANNNFLLHGYYNYHHLALLDDGKGLRLGVPGIYHPQEAKAAGAFGFTEFMPVQDIRVELTEEERNDQEQFGYWCRHVKGQMPDSSCALPQHLEGDAGRDKQ